jgi:two-component system, sensor histidine kinase RegB
MPETTTAAPPSTPLSTARVGASSTAAAGQSRASMSEAPAGTRGGAAAGARWWLDDLGAGGPLGEGRVRFVTLAVMRWVAFGGQLFTVLFVHFSLGIELPLAWLLPALLLTFGVNLTVQVKRPPTARLGDRPMFALMLFDVLQLAYLLALTGGLQNPFMLLLVVPVGLGAATLNRLFTAGLTAAALFALATMAAMPTELPWIDGSLRLPPLYLFASWLAMSLTVLLVAGYVWRLADDARRHALALSATQLALAREQQLSALGGQAAAAAHLLGTPLATINVIAKELVRELPPDSPLKEDADELLAQAQRCRETLASLGSGRRDATHSAFTKAPLSGLLNTIAEAYRNGIVAVDVMVDVAEGLSEPRVSLAPELRHAIANLVDNAVRFATRRVEIVVAVDAQGVVVEIADDGPGFMPEVLDWLGEPYLSTRRKEGGLGLGVFIAKTLLARTGATVHFANRDKLSHRTKGALVRIGWPAGALEQLGREPTRDD